MKRDKKSDSLTIRMSPKMKWKLYLISLREERTMTDLVEEAIMIYLSNRQTSFRRNPSHELLLYQR